jgi:hypothetical protein
VLPPNEELPMHPDVDRLMAQASPADLHRANERFRLVQAYLEHRADFYAGIPPHTLRRWVRSFQQAQASLGCGYVGSLPRISQRGNRTPKALQDGPRLCARTVIGPELDIPAHFKVRSPERSIAIITRV